ncbi:hypothetical protein SB581_12120 [Acinetobacter baumannii]|nr:hypothetical protein SB581_12120 [Acinetobacter baumannii]
MSENYTLNFLNENEFEIICKDYNDIGALRRNLENKPFIFNISLVDVRGANYLQKIIGIASSKENLDAFLKEWFELLYSHDVTTFKDFDKD